MQRFEIQPLLGSGLGEVASFLHRQLADRDAGTSFQEADREDCPSIERRLRWLLFGNPVTRENPQHGFCVRDPAGLIRGVTLCFPGVFLAGDQRLLGLGSGSFFVEPQARTAGFYLFKKYLGSPGYSFFFSTTCNANSAALFRQLGGCHVLNSEPEYVLPLKLDTLLPALVAEGAFGGALSAGARMFGRWANPLLRFLERQSTKLIIEPCQDWRKLSDLFRRHLPKDRITTDRSTEYLLWRYGQNADPYPSGVYLFRDQSGNEGWFSLGNKIRGREGQIRGSVLLDTIWPRDKMSFRDIFPAILRLVGGSADALIFRSRPGLDYGECSRWIIPRRGVAPSVFAITRKGDPFTVASLDLAYADGDGALPISPVSWRKTTDFASPISAAR